MEQVIWHSRLFWGKFFGNFGASFELWTLHLIDAGSRSRDRLPHTKNWKYGSPIAETSQRFVHLLTKSVRL